MARSLTLSALRALRRGGSDPAPTAAPPRPEGPLVWAHAVDSARIGPLLALADSPAAEDGGIHFLVTAPEIPAGTPSGQRVTLLPAPPDLAGAVTAFLDRWQPDMLVWSGGQFRPLLLSAAMERIPPGRRILVDARAAALAAEGLSWLPGAARALAAGFDHALACDALAARRLHRLGLPAARVEITGPLGSLPPVLACNERERRDLVQTLAARPVWLAAGFAAAELPHLVTAQRSAIRGSHRLLLVALPRDPADLPAAAAAFRDAGLIPALRAEGEDPGDTAQVLLADSMAELGLWYRIAPVTFAGATLPGSGGGSRPPSEVAALGSALVHGPETQPHGPAYQRLARAGAARLVRDGAALGLTVEALLAPDRAAAMAHAAWEVTTDGIEVANRLADLIRAGLAEVDR
jgi:3-deoxy-D-manno-octulosonic-acid transferase